MPPKTTTWELEAHTIGKHLVLQHYMGAWLPIMSRWNGRVLFIDAFAGPGEYSRGEPGSPVIALRSLINHRAKGQMQSEINYLFIENDSDRYEHLTNVLDGLKEQIPPKCKYEIIKSTFDDTLTQVLDSIDEQKAYLAPAFVMIDPFGVTGTPMSLIGRIFENPKSEIYISFMYRDINRFKTHPSFEKHLDQLFGCSEWRQGIDRPEGKERKDFFYHLYSDQLKANGAKQVIKFELYEKNQLVYSIFFGTKNLEGCDKMKQAIWKVAPFGDFAFRGSELGQFMLGDSVVDFSQLEQALQNQFRPKGWQKIETITDFVKSDATEFHSGHLKVKTLRPMEVAGKIEVQADTRNKPSTYPPGTILRFL